LKGVLEAKTRRSGMQSAEQPSPSVLLLSSQVSLARRLRVPSPQAGMRQSASQLVVCVPPWSQGSGPFCEASPQYSTVTQPGAHASGPGGVALYGASALTPLSQGSGATTTASPQTLHCSGHVNTSSPGPQAGSSSQGGGSPVDDDVSDDDESLDVEEDSAVEVVEDSAEEDVEDSAEDVVPRSVVGLRQAGTRTRTRTAWRITGPRSSRGGGSRNRRTGRGWSRWRRWRRTCRWWWRCRRLRSRRCSAGRRRRSRRGRCW
jgi:hypothetical protein